MSDNPFASPPSPGTPGNQGDSILQAQSVGPKVASGALTTILIFCLILGIFGLFGTCATGVFLGLQSTFEEMALNQPMAVEQKEFQRMNMEVQKKVMVPGLVLAFINLFVATMLIVGSVGGLRGKESGRKLLRVALLLAMVYLVLKIIVTIYTGFVTVSGLNDAVANYQGEADPAALETMLQFGKIGAMVGTGFGVLFPFAILGFYIWARIYLNKHQVVEYFESKSQSQF